MLFSRKKEILFFFSPIAGGNLQDKVESPDAFQTQLFSLRFKAFLLKLETGSFPSFISVCC